MSEMELYQQLAEKIDLGSSERIPKLFRMAANEDEARLLLAMPGTLEELAAKVEMPPEKVKEMIDFLFKRGLAFESVKPEGTIYRMSRNLTQFHDATVLYKDVSENFLDLWLEFREEEWPEIASAIVEMMPRAVLRVIPIDTTVETGSQILDFEGARKIIEGARNLAVTDCPCRLAARKCDAPLEVCIQLDRAADYALKRGTGKPLTKEQAVEILELSEKDGLVHCMENRSGVGNIICNCCECCCQFTNIVIKFGKQICDPSRYQAVIDQEACSGCETCLDRCMFEAIEMVEVSGGDNPVSSVIVEKCMGCGVCATSCPEEAITLKETRPVEFIPENPMKG